jgi:predicted TPR repeat methyltransferase
MDGNDTLQEAIAAHQAGRLDVAQSAYERVLTQRPDDAKALYFFGLLQFHRGAVDAALKHVARSLELAPKNPQAWNVFGSMLTRAARLAEARAAYQKSIELAPQFAEGWYNLGISLRDEGNVPRAIECLRTAISRQADYLLAYGALADLLQQSGLIEQAAEVYREWAQREPMNAYAYHMAVATSGLQAPSRASDEFVTEYFDRFADEFDGKLERLGYRAPGLVSEALLRNSSPDARLDELDAGCGTGLCGPLLRERCRTLIGVDLSAKMLDRARERHVYDELIVGELTELMQTKPDTFDAIVSADTLVYFGDLEPVFTAAYRALRRDGLLIFTVEALETADGHKLQPHGRFAHSESYIRQALARAGFVVNELTRETLRVEGAQDATGFLVVGRRT